MRNSILCFCLCLAVLFTCACKRETPAREGVWLMSKDRVSWAPVQLPDTDWKCENCDRSYKTIVRDVPRAVSFRFASDNKAWMIVNGKEVFADFWKDAYCSDKPCCSDCCDSSENCARLIGSAKSYSLSAEALKAFRAGDNEVVWEVHQETGGSGFEVVMNAAK